MESKIATYIIEVLNEPFQYENNSCKKTVVVRTYVENKLVTKTKYGLVDAEILNVSNDATPDEKLGLVYAMRVKMFQTKMKVKEKIINLSPGMAVTVEVNLGKRRLIEFLLSPLLRYKDESVRER